MAILLRVSEAVGKLFAKPRNEMDLALGEAFDKATADFAREAGAKPEWLRLAAPLVERFEGLHKLLPGGKVQAYPDPATGGKPWTIGIGSTRDEQGRPIKPGDVWTVDRARRHFERELEEYGAAVAKAIGSAPTKPCQMAAMVSLAYNIGVTAFSRSTVLRQHKTGNYPTAADAFMMWDKAAGKVMKGLTRRRAAEAQLYRRP